jgi:exopolyphosphatase/guanosine-5'-triphosphate,3'-diphosphate pyrophosphatase
MRLCAFLLQAWPRITRLALDSGGQVLLGVLDIGSKSAQLQVVEVRPGAPPLPTLAVKEPTLLGEAFDAEGSIDIAGVDRVVAAVERALDVARRLGVE